MEQKIDNILYLNLDRREDRKKDFEKSIEKILDDKQYKFIRYPAVNGVELEMNPELCYLLRANAFNQRRNVVGCALSHINFWKKILKECKSDDEYGIIVEDDVIFCPNFRMKFKKLKTLIPTMKNLHLIWMCYRITPHLEETKKYNDISEKSLKLVEMRKNNYWCGTEGYLITKRGARFLLNAIEKVGLKVPVDTLMMWATRNVFGPFNDFGVVPRMGRSFTATETNNVDSDIQGDMEKVKYNLEIIILKPELFESNKMLLEFIKQKYSYVEMSEISKDIKPNQMILTKICPQLSTNIKIPVIHVIDDINNIEEINKNKGLDHHYLCQNKIIKDKIKSFRKSTYEILEDISENIEVYYFNYWKNYFR